MNHELSNIPEINEHFETIPPVPMETTNALWSYIQTGIMSLWGIHANGRIIGGAGFYAQPPGTRLSLAATFFSISNLHSGDRGSVPGHSGFLKKKLVAGDISAWSAWWQRQIRVPSGFTSGRGMKWRGEKAGFPAEQFLRGYGTVG